MKNQKINLNWQSMLLGMALCLVLVFFVGSKVADPQVTSGVVQRASGLERAPNINDIWEKTSAMDARLVAMDERLVRMEVKLDELGKDINRVLKALDKMWKQDNKN